METKICFICKIEKPISEFRSSYCIPCKKEYEKQHNHKRREWNDKNKDKARKYNNKYFNKPEIKQKSKDYMLEYNSLEHNKKRKKEYSKLYNPGYKKHKRKTDPFWQLKENMRVSICQSFKRIGSIKPSRTEQILGCTFEQFKQHIESQFEPWMNWENQGGQIITEINTNWDIDHKIPISSAKTKDDVIKLSHYTNFQPLCSYVNRFVKRNN